MTKMSRVYSHLRFLNKDLHSDICKINTTKPVVSYITKLCMEQHMRLTTYVFISSPLCCISSFSAPCQWCAQDAMAQLLMIFCFHVVTAVLGHGGIAFKHTSAVCWILTILKVFSISLVQRKRWCTSGMFSSWTVWLLIICGLPVSVYSTSYLWVSWWEAEFSYIVPSAVKIM